MPDESNPAVQRAKTAICAYLQRHPAAADSECGIAQWWLPSLGVHIDMREVGLALHELWLGGFIRRTDLPGGGAIYWRPSPPSDAQAPADAGTPQRS